MDSMELANRAIGKLNGDYTPKGIKRAVLYACVESPDLVLQDVIDEAVARIERGKSVADKVKAARSV